MNEYLRYVEKVEFVVTYACSGNCKHCSEGEHGKSGVNIDPKTAAEAVRRLAGIFDLKTVMAFGGEPLLYPEAVYAIMEAAKEFSVPKRQVITNGYFSKKGEVIRNTAEKLSSCGVNELLLSVDAFHQETIPLEVVKLFAFEAKRAGLNIKIQPAWLVSRTHENDYNKLTEKLISEFREMGICENEGNIVFPEGNALKYLAEYFTSDIPSNPYVDDPKKIKCISFDPDGGVLGGNIYENDILDIIKAYRP